MPFFTQDLSKHMRSHIVFGMNRLNSKDRTQILGLLVEGNSMRAISRLTGVSINTVTKLLVDVGTACSEYQDQTLRNLPCKRIQCNEIWSFCGMKEKDVLPGWSPGCVLCKGLCGGSGRTARKPRPAHHR